MSKDKIPMSIWRQPYSPVSVEKIKWIFPVDKDYCGVKFKIPFTVNNDSDFRIKTEDVLDFLHNGSINRNIVDPVILQADDEKAKFLQWFEEPFE